MGAVRASPAEFAVVVGVVAIAAKRPRAHGAPERGAVELQHLRQQARLRKNAAAIVCYGMARGCGQRKLGNHVQWIAR